MPSNRPKEDFRSRIPTSVDVHDKLSHVITAVTTIKEELKGKVPLPVYLWCLPTCQVPLLLPALLPAHNPQYYPLGDADPDGLTLGRHRCLT